MEEGWVDWDGDVENTPKGWGYLRFRDGEEYHVTQPFEFFEWSHDGSGDDIVQYMPTKEDA